MDCQLAILEIALKNNSNKTVMRQGAFYMMWSPNIELYCVQFPCFSTDQGAKHQGALLYMPKIFGVGFKVCGIMISLWHILTCVLAGLQITYFGDVEF